MSVQLAKDLQALSSFAQFQRLAEPAVGNGITFLGYVVRPHVRPVRRRVVGHLRDRLARHRRRICSSASLWELPPGRVDELQATLASCYDHLRHAQAARLRAAVFCSELWLAPDQQARAGKSARTDPPRHGQGDGQPIARGGLPAGLSWPLSAGETLMAALRRRCIAYARIAEHGCVKDRLRRRHLLATYVSADPSASAPAIDIHVPGVQP